MVPNDICLLKFIKPHSQVTYSDKPPIEDILRQFQRAPSCSAKFVIREETDYVNLGFYVTILGVAISDIRGYVNQERQDVKKTLTEPDHSASKPLVGLKALRDELEALHSKICTTYSLCLVVVR